MIPVGEPSVELHCREYTVIVTSDEQIQLSTASPVASRRKSKRGNPIRLILGSLAVVFGLISVALLFLHFHSPKTNALTMGAMSSGKGTMSSAAEKYNTNHAPVISPPVRSQLHQDVVRVLRTAQYNAFAALLDNVTQSVVRQGVTVFAPSDGALSNFQKKKTEGLRLEDVVQFHVITDIMPFSNLLRLEVGSRLTTDVSNITILVTNATAGAYEVDDAVIIDPDLYTDATIAVHGINAVFNTSKIGEAESGKPVNGGGSPEGVLPFPFHSRAFKTPITVKDVPAFQIFMSFAGLFLINLILEI